MKTKVIFGLLAIGIVALLVYVAENQPLETGVKIGVITPLTGGVAYWGESSLVGIRLAEKELEEKGIHIDVIVEDSQLDPKIGLNAAQKLVNVDNVDAVFTEFNAITIPVSSFLKDKNAVQIYNAPPISPLAESDNFFKTYLDYEKSCEEVAEVLKERGYVKIGILKMNLEHGELCVKGIKSVFDEAVVVESYNMGVRDFRTPLAKLNASGVDVIFHGALQQETLASLKNMRELGMHQPFVALAENITPEVSEEFRDVLTSAVIFGLPKISSELAARLDAIAPEQKVLDQNAAALAYLHVMQLGEALSTCRKEITCTREKISNAAANADVGFLGYTDRIAGFDTLIQEWDGNRFIQVR